MGVQGLWELLTPVGRRVSVETLAGRKLAIDASIWIIQFMKAMRDDRGEMIRNAHLIGFFRRICKLLFLRVKPVFVFDGGTPALKRRTVIARRRQRENAQAKIRKTAEKLLLNHLKTRKLEDLVRQIHNPKSNENSAGGKNEGRVDIGEKGDAGCSSQAVNINGSYEANDALLAASLAAEGQLEIEVSTSPEEIHSEESEDMDESDQMILPVMQGKVDPSVLAVLPPSMQLDLLVQMREQLMADNRQKFQKVKKAPASFSQLQIEAYLKTVAFRREIEEVQKSAAGKGIGGMQTSRIASESGREFVFSSSFSGDKQALQFPGSNTDETEGRPATKEKAPDVSSVESSKLSSSMLSYNCAAQPHDKASDGNSDPPVQTYIDEKGQVRVSRVRGMGVRLTRDLQWNLYLMKESEDQALKTAENDGRGSDSNRAIQKDEMLTRQADIGHCQMNEDEARNLGMADIGYENESFCNTSTGEKEIPIKEYNHVLSNPQVVSGKGLQISFSEDEIGELGQEDELFTALVAGETVPDESRGINGCNQLENETSECEWEEGQLQLNDNEESEVLQGRSGIANVKKVSEAAPIEGSAISGDSEVEWEDGNNLAACDTTFPSKGEKISSRGLPSEEEELQEAIRRSLEEFHAHRGKGSFSKLVLKEIPEESRENVAQVDTPVHVSPRRKELGGITDKVEGNKFFVEETERRGKTLLTEEVDEFSGKYNSKLKSHIEQSSQELVEKSETGLTPMMIEEFSSEKHGKESGISTTVNEKDVEDPYFLTPNDIQWSATLQEFPIPNESNILNELDKMERSCQPDGRELQKENKVTTLKRTEPMTVQHTVADNITGGLKFVISVSGEMVSCNDGAVPLDLNQVQAVNTQSESLSEENLIREAEEADISKDRETLLKKEAELLAMKEEHLRRKEKIQAELEAEKEAMQAGMDEEMAFLRQEELDLRAAQKKNERNAESVTGEMFAECQELLQIFGLPYIIAPMEAEAQCAFMELVHLVDGVVTDDCDAFLFGAGTVYKNIFDERKYVETYLMKDIEEELGLNREKLVRMALLLGSDYTEGISGIGIVNAIEVVNAFPEEDGLKKFREWLDSPDPSILNKVHACSGKVSRKRPLKSSKKNGSVAGEDEGGIIPDLSTDSHQEEELSEEGNSVLKQIFMEKHRAVSKNWHIPESFPNVAVISAYTAPQVDKSTEPFSWGRPDLMSLRKLCWEKFGWAKEKADELLLPVLKEYDRHETQLRLEAFYSFNERFAKIRSRRIQKAVTGITGRRSSETMDLPPHLTSTPQKRSRKKKENSVSDIPDQTMGDTRNERVSSDVECFQSNKNRKQERKKKLHNDLLEPENTADKVSTTGRGKGRGRGRRGKGGASRVCGRREEPTNSADHSGSEKENEDSEQGQLKRKFSAEIVEIRKSTRPRKDVNYAPDEQGSDSECRMYNESDIDMSCEASTVKVFQKGPATSSDSFRKCSEEIDLQTNLELEHLEDVGVRDERLYSDYLATGGGFCTEEENHEDGLHTNKGDENDIEFSARDSIKCSSSDCVQVGLSNNFSSRDKNLDAMSSGGGFCVSENADCLASGKDLTTNNTKELEFKDGEIADVITEREPRSDNSASAVGLRAIPFLRRKKRSSN